MTKSQIELESDGAFSWSLELLWTLHIKKWSFGAWSPPGLTESAAICLRKEGLRYHRHPLFNFLRAFRDDALTGFESFFDNPFGPRPFADFDRTDMGPVLVVHNGDLIAGLQFYDRALRDQQRTASRLRPGAHAGELAGTEEIIGVREKAG